MEAHKPTQLHVNSTFHFGASTRRYILRERPSAGQRNSIMEDIPMSETSDGALLGLPETQTELDVNYDKFNNKSFLIFFIIFFLLNRISRNIIPPIIVEFLCWV